MLLKYCILRNFVISSYLGITMFGERLRSLRKELDLSQADLGKVLDLSCTAISQYESETRFPDCETIIKISNYFDVSLDYLFGLIDMRTPPLKDGAMVIDCCGFTDEQLETVKFLTKSFKVINKRNNSNNN